MAVSVKITGSKQVLANVRLLPKRFRRKGFRVALSAAGGVFKRETTKRAPKETGILKRSMRVKVAVPDNERAAWVKVGPGRGLKQEVTAKKSGGLKTVSKKLTSSRPAALTTKYRVPTRYAHLVEDGTKRGMRGTRFMKLSASLKQTEAVAKMESKLRSAVWNYRNN